jgi:hypothetical protein
MDQSQSRLKKQTLTLKTRKMTKQLFFIGRDSFWPSLGQSEPAHRPLDAPYDSVVDELSTELISGFTMVTHHPMYQSVFIYNILGFVRLRWCLVVLSIHPSHHPSPHPSIQVPHPGRRR